MQFTPRQEQAIDAVGCWYRGREKPIFRVFGYAGTGKTTLARHFASGVKGDVQYAAFTGKAAMVMRKNGCAGASTIHSIIYKVEQDEITGKTSFKKRPKFELERVKLFIVDECSMVDDDLGKDLQSFGIPILVLGDPGQLPAISGAGYFTSGEPDVMLDEIHRQAADNPIIRIATDIREGRRLERGDYGAVKIIPRSAVTPELVTSASQVLVGLNRTRQSYNARLRELAGREGKFPTAGDRLVALKNDHANGILNGGLWNVLEIKKPTKMDVADCCIRMLVTSLDFDNLAPVDVRCREEFFTGQEKEIPWKELRGTQQFDFGYALTVHKSQGSQWDHVCVFDESSSFGADAARHRYTAVTRASETLTLVM